MGWSDIQNEPKPTEQDLTKISRFRGLAAQVFELNPLGKEFLEMLEEYIDRPVANPAEGEQASAWAFFRQGENNIIDLIKKSISRHTIKGENPNG